MTKPSASEPTHSDFIDEDPAAEFLGTTKYHLRHLRQNGEGPAYTKIGSRVKYKISWLREYAESRKVTPNNNTA